MNGVPLGHRLCIRTQDVLGLSMGDGLGYVNGVPLGHRLCIRTQDGLGWS